MKFTLSWLKDHLETTASLDEIVEALTDVGLEVEAVVNPAERLKSFTIGYITKAEKHPDADKLRVCLVNTKDGEKQIICGAPNAREGIYVVVATPGTYVPGIDTTIQIGKIRGIESFGMMCSEREMELSDEHDGIIEMKTGEIGRPFVSYLAESKPDLVDPVIEIKITPNRPDALGVRGIARDLAARGLGSLKPAKSNKINGSFENPIKVNIADDTRDGCLFFAGRYVRNVKNGPSPEWLQNRLRAIGLRPISALVDITNFFTFDRNRPLHVFDADKLQGNITVRRARGDETFTALDKKDYQISKDTVLITDDNQPEAIGGIIGGLASACCDETTNVFIEAAIWNTIDIATAGRKHKINTDARYRNERGIDPNYNLEGLDDATALLIELCGGEASDLSIAGELPKADRDYKFDPKRTTSLVGLEIDAEEQKQILEKLGFEFKGDRVTPPSWRPDIMSDVDLIEEIVRIKSLTKLKGQPLPRESSGIPRPILSPSQTRARLLRRVLAMNGMNEVVTYSFISEKSAKLFGGGSDAVRVANPISQDMSHLRPNLYAGLIEAAARNNARGFSDLALFELGQGWRGGEPEDQINLAAGIMMGNAVSRSTFAQQRPFDVFDGKAMLEAALTALDLDFEKLTLIPHDAPWFHPSRSAKLGLGPQNIIAEFGEIHPKVSKTLGLKTRVMAFAIFYDNLPNTRKKITTRSALLLNDFQQVSRDFAFVVDTKTTSYELVKAVRAANKKLIQNVVLFDVFEGEKAESQMGKGKKSLAISVTLAPQDRTLTEEEINATSRGIIEQAKKIGATLRS